VDKRLLEEIREKLAPNKIWSLRPEIKTILETEISTLPKKRQMKEAERRYPSTPSGMSVFLNAFFARHFFQVQDSILQTEAFEKFYGSVQQGKVNIADIGSGPAVASLAVLDLLDAIHETIRIPRTKLNIVLNDTSTVCLQTGQKMLHSFLKQILNQMLVRNTIAVDTPFPKSLNQFRRISSLVGLYDLCFMSYVLIPLKEEMTHDDIQAQIHELQRYCSKESLCIILQDKFRESLIRHTGRLQGVSTHKATLVQTVYDKNNSNTEQAYTYYRTIIMPGLTPKAHGVSTRFCLQNIAAM
jgi:hypothetical protein